VPGGRGAQEDVMRFEHRFLSDDDLARAHEESLRILGDVGVKFRGERALPLLEGAGARVDHETGIARIPRDLVEAALRTAPKAFTLGARNPAHAYRLPSPVSRYGLDGTGTFVIDFETGKRRYATLADVRDAMRVFQAADMGVMAWPPVSASDVPAESRPLHEFLAMAATCSKHGQHELHTAAQVPFLIAGLAAIMGGEDALRQSHAYSLIYCPVAPLTHDGEMLDGYLELGRVDLPIMVMPMPVTGTTGPASLFGNICVANAEALSSMVVFQLANPGRPMVYSSATGTMDFRTGAFLGGTPEMGLMAAALTDMGKFYDLPTTSAGCTSDAHQPGPEAVLEKLVSMLPPVIAGSDIIVGFGEVEGDQALALEQILVDNELARQCERLYQGISTVAGAELSADTTEVGPGGNYLACRSTRTATRSGEFLAPDLIERRPFEAWEAAGRPTMYEKARERVREILAGPQVDPLPEATTRALAEILAEADRALAGAEAGFGASAGPTAPVAAR
jgi:trimethylamine---corrinoid protein Co-methyltransferase